MRPARIRAGRRDGETFMTKDFLSTCAALLSRMIVAAPSVPAATLLYSVADG